MYLLRTRLVPSQSERAARSNQRARSTAGRPAGQAVGEDEGRETQTRAKKNIENTPRVQIASNQLGPPHPHQMNVSCLGAW